MEKVTENTLMLIANEEDQQNVNVDGLKNKEDIDDAEHLLTNISNQTEHASEENAKEEKCEVQSDAKELSPIMQNVEKSKENITSIVNEENAFSVSNGKQEIEPAQKPISSIMDAVSEVVKVDIEGNLNKEIDSATFANKGNTNEDVDVSAGKRSSRKRNQKIENRNIDDIKEDKEISKEEEKIVVGKRLARGKRNEVLHETPSANDERKKQEKSTVKKPKEDILPQSQVEIHQKTEKEVNEVSQKHGTRGITKTLT